MDQIDRKPLWQYVTKLEKPSQAGGNIPFKCHFCNNNFKGTYSRVKYHLLHTKGGGIKPCPKVTTQQIKDMVRMVEEADQKVEKTQPKNVPLPSSGAASASFQKEGYVPKKRKGIENTEIDKAFQVAKREALKEEIGRMFYSAGLPFHLARNPHYVKAFKLACESNLSGFTPPGYNALRTVLLQRERSNVETLLQPIKTTWKNKGISLVSDGWTDCQRRPLINFIAVCESGPMFLKAVNCEGDYKDKFFIAGKIKEVIAEVGSQNVVQVITDNAPVCKSAGLLVEAQYPHVFWTPCVVHTLNLALKNICAAKNTEANGITYEECHWITIVSGDASFVKNFIMNHTMRLAMFNRFVKLKLLAITETRFASILVMLKRFKLIKEGLQHLVISDEWNAYKEDDTRKASFVKEKILDDLWWQKIDYILSFTNPIYEMLRILDTDKPSLHLVYDMWSTMITDVRKVIYLHENKQEHEESTFWNVVNDILHDRWTKSNTPLHCMAHSLNPRYYYPEWVNGAPGCIEPHKDIGISSERDKCMKRYYPDPVERRAVNIEFAKFSSLMGEFGGQDSIRDRFFVDPIMWWVIHGSSTPNLQSLALKLLCQPCSSSCSERNWSTYSFIHSLKRNKMAPQRAEDLVYIHQNLRLLSRRTPQYLEGECKMWDIGGDAFDSLDEVGVLEVANLSLDEPEMEAVLLDLEDDDFDFLEVV